MNMIEVLKSWLPENGGLMFERLCEQVSLESARTFYAVVKQRDALAKVEARREANRMAKAEARRAAKLDRED